MHNVLLGNVLQRSLEHSSHHGFDACHHLGRRRNVGATPGEPGTGAPNVSTIITNGKFSFPVAQGPVPGSYIFEFSLLPPGAVPPDPSASPEGERETGPTVTYRKTVEIPEQGSDSLAIELTPADVVREQPVF